jgi:hypothetical protein
VNLDGQKSQYATRTGPEEDGVPALGKAEVELGVAGEALVEEAGVEEEVGELESKPEVS